MLFRSMALMTISVTIGKIDVSEKVFHEYATRKYGRAYFNSETLLSQISQELTNLVEDDQAKAVHIINSWLAD